MGTDTGDTASGRSGPGIWRRVLYPHSPFGLVARLSATHKRAQTVSEEKEKKRERCTRGLCDRLLGRRERERERERASERERSVIDNQEVTEGQSVSE